MKPKTPGTRPFNQLRGIETAAGLALAIAIALPSLLSACGPQTRQGAGAAAAPSPGPSPVPSAVAAQRSALRQAVFDTKYDCRITKVLDESKDIPCTVSLTTVKQANGMQRPRISFYADGTDIGVDEWLSRPQICGGGLVVPGANALLPGGFALQSGCSGAGPGSSTYFLKTATPLSDPSFSGTAFAIEIIATLSGIGNEFDPAHSSISIKKCGFRDACDSPADDAAVDPSLTKHQ